MATTQTQLKAITTDEQDDELGPREDCWCTGNDLACFGHFQTEREDQ